MNVHVSYIAVVLAALSSFAVGMIWYARPVFGRPWSKLVGMDESRQKKGMVPALIITLVCSLLTAYILAHLIYLANTFFGNSFLQDALSTAAWVGLGIAVTTVVTHDAFEQRNRKLTLINAASRLLTLLVMGLIIGLIKP